MYQERLPPQSDSLSSSSSHPSSPESRPVDRRSPIPEEDEEDETSSETGNEPVTPTDSHHAHAHGHGQSFHEKLTGMLADPRTVLKGMPSQPSLSLNTKTTPIATSKKGVDSAVEAPTPKTPTSKKPLSRRPTASTVQGKDSSIKRAMSGIFKRSHSHTSNAPTTTQSVPQPIEQIPTDVPTLSTNNGSDPVLGKEHRRMSLRGMSGSNSTSAFTTRSNTPPSPASLTDNGRTQVSLQDPTAEDFLANEKRKNRASTGLALRDRLSNITFAPSVTPRPGLHRNRATSVDLDEFSRSNKGSNAQLPERQIWGMAADTGTGLKARRLSLSLPDDFWVDVVELYSEYSDQSKIVGRRGKSVGKGATANVRLMTKKRGNTGEFYAVKEFRGKSTTEKEEDYEKKVKSEYSIAKSAHHPNIVETFRLCTHNGRWNQVMEFCDQGDLFSLVSQKYLSKEDHLSDRLCLFKQLVQGLNYLHSHGIAHRDIKLENILVTRDSKLKITDFGVSEIFAGIHPGLRAAAGQCGKDMGEVRLCAPGMCGSPPYVAPEVIAKNGEYDPRPLDVWGAAIVMLCMCANGILWEEAKAGSSPLYDDLIRGWTKWNSRHVDSSTPGITETDYPHVTFFDQHISPPALRRVLLTMLNPDPGKRVSMAAVAKNRWVKNIECCQIDSYDDPATIIDVSKSRTNLKGMVKVVHHNHLPPSKHLGHKMVRLPGSTAM